MRIRIRELREARGMSQADLAKLIGTSSVSIGRYEKQPSRITLPLLEKLASALMCLPSDIIGDGKIISRVVSVPILGGTSSLALDAGIAEGIGHAGELEAFTVTDDAMAPTLTVGDICVIDAAITVADRDGVFAIKSKERIVIRRISVNPVNHQLRVTSDNPLYGAPIDARPKDLKVEGRVVWAGKRL